MSSESFLRASLTSRVINVLCPSLAGAGRKVSEQRSKGPALRPESLHCFAATGLADSFIDSFNSEAGLSAIFKEGVAADAEVVFEDHRK